MGAAGTKAGAGGGGEDIGSQQSASGSLLQEGLHQDGRSILVGGKLADHN